MIYLAQDLGYFDQETTEDIMNKLNKISGSIANLIKYLKNPKTP